MSKQTRPAGASLARLAATAAASVVLLGGCSDEQQEIRAWMQQQRASMPAIKETIPPPKIYEPFRYENAGQSDPFEVTRLAARGGVAGSGLKPDTNRRREALESFPLDSIRMVGHMSNGRNTFALLQVDRTVYQARVGNYAGLNYGMITRVTESEIKLKELVQDAAGDWIERETALQLQEGPVQETKK